MPEPPRAVFEFAKPRRFFYHWRRCDGWMSLHFAGACHRVWDVEARAVTRTKRNKTQPRIVEQGFARRITITGDVAVIE